MMTIEVPAEIETMTGEMIEIEMMIGEMIETATKGITAAIEIATVMTTGHIPVVGGA